MTMISEKEKEKEKEKQTEETYNMDTYKLRLDTVYAESTRTIKLKDASKITVDPDHELLAKMRKDARKDLTAEQREALKKDFEEEFKSIMHTSLRAIAEQCRTCNKIHGFRSDWLNVPEKLMLIITEMSEAMKAYRCIDPKLLKIITDTSPEEKTHLPKKFDDSIDKIMNFKEEMADTLIRLLDLMYALNIDIEFEMARKMATNELRVYKHGKHL